MAGDSVAGKPVRAAAPVIVSYAGELWWDHSWASHFYGLRVNGRWWHRFGCRLADGASVSDYPANSAFYLLTNLGRYYASGSGPETYAGSLAKLRDGSLPIRMHRRRVEHAPLASGVCTVENLSYCHGLNVLARSAPEPLDGLWHRVPTVGNTGTVSYAAMFPSPLLLNGIQVTDDLLESWIAEVCSGDADAGAASLSDLNSVELAVATVLVMAGNDVVNSGGNLYAYYVELEFDGRAMPIAMARELDLTPAIGWRET